MVFVSMGGKVIFTGVASYQKGAVVIPRSEGETVTMGITKPDGTLSAIPTTLDGYGGFSVEYTDEVGPGYSAIAFIGENDVSLEATSQPIPFQIGKYTTTITLQVTSG